MGGQPLEDRDQGRAVGLARGEPTQHGGSLSSRRSASRRSPRDETVPAPARPPATPSSGADQHGRAERVRRCAAAPGRAGPAPAPARAGRRRRKADQRPDDQLAPAEVAEHEAERRRPAARRRSPGRRGAPATAASRRRPAPTSPTAARASASGSRSSAAGEQQQRDHGTGAAAARRPWAAGGCAGRRRASATPTGTTSSTAGSAPVQPRPTSPGQPAGHRARPAAATCGPARDRRADLGVHRVRQPADEAGHEQSRRAAGRGRDGSAGVRAHRRPTVRRARARPRGASPPAARAGR